MRVDEEAEASEGRGIREEEGSECRGMRGTSGRAPLEGPPTLSSESSRTAAMGAKSFGEAVP